MSNILKQFENREDPCWLLLKVPHGSTTAEGKDDDWSEVSSLGSDCSWGSSESEEDEASTLSETSMSSLSDHNNNVVDVDVELPLMGQLRLRRRPCIERSLSSKSRWDSGSKCGGSQCWSTKLPAPDRKSRRQSRQSKKRTTNDHEEHEEETALHSKKPTQRQASLLTLPPRLGRLERQSLRSIYSTKDHHDHDHDHDGEQRPMTRRSQTLEPATRAKSFQGGTRDGPPDLRRRQTIGSTSGSSSLQKCRSRSSMSLQQWQLLNRPQDMILRKKQMMKTTTSSSGSYQVAPRRSVTLETILPSAASQAAIQQGVPALRRSKTTGTPSLKEWQGRRMRRRQVADLPVTVQVPVDNRNTAATTTTTTKPLPSSRGNVSTTASSVSSLPVRGLIRVGPPRLSNSTRSLNKFLVRNRSIERKPSSGALLSEATQERIRQSLLSTTTTMKNAAWPEAAPQGKSPASKGTIKLGIATKARLRKTLSMPQQRTNKSSSSSESSSSIKSLRKTQSLQQRPQKEEEEEQRPSTTKSMQDTLRETISLALAELDNGPMTTTTPAATPSGRNQRQPLGWGQPLEAVVPPNKVISVRRHTKQKPSPTRRVKMLNDDDAASDDSAIPGSTRSFPPCSASSGEASLVSSPSVICKNVAWMPHEKQPSSTATTTTASRLVAKKIPVRQAPLLAALRDDFKNHAAAAASATTRSGDSRGCAA